MLLTTIYKASSTPYCWDDRQRRRIYGGGFHKRMIKFQRVDIETCLEQVLILIRTESDLQKSSKMTITNVGVKIGYDEINVGKTSDKIFSSIKVKKKSRKNGKNYQRSNDQFVETNRLDRLWNSARPFARLDQVQFGERPSGIERGFSSAVRRAGPGVRLHLVLVTPLPRLHQTHSCFVSIGGIVGTLRFKNRKNSFFLKEHSDWWYKMATVSWTRKVAYAIREIWMFFGIDAVSEALLL